jgi:hypothetical protein
MVLLLKLNHYFENMNHLIKKAGEAKKELLQMLETKLRPSW